MTIQNSQKKTSASNPPFLSFRRWGRRGSAGLSGGQVVPRWLVEGGRPGLAWPGRGGGLTTSLLAGLWNCEGDKEGRESSKTKGGEHPCLAMQLGQSAFKCHRRPFERKRDRVAPQKIGNLLDPWKPFGRAGKKTRKKTKKHFFSFSTSEISWVFVHMRVSFTPALSPSPISHS